MKAPSGLSYPWDGRRWEARITESFWSQVDDSGTCWRWTGRITENYGAFSYARARGVRPHRFIYEAFTGQPPGSKVVYQTCGDRLCVTPDHLVLRTTGNQPKSMLEHLRERGIDTSSPTACWTWNGVINKWGYGQVRNGKGAHRETYIELVGPIPDGLTIDHLCRNWACVNPDHLEPVTQAENNRRAGLWRRRTHCMRGHELSGDNILPPSRKCRTCLAMRSKRHYERTKATR